MTQIRTLLDTSIDDSIDLNIEFEIGKRLSSSGFAHLSLLAVVLFFTPFINDHRKITIAISLPLIIFSILRIIISLKQKTFYPNKKKIWLLLFDLFLLITATFWGLFCVASIHYYGLTSATTSILLLIISGICSGAASSLNPSSLRAKIFIGITLILPILDIIYIKNSLSYAFALIFIIYGIFLYIQIRNQSNIYLNLLLTKQTTENQKREIESALQVAESALQNKARFIANMSHEIRTPMNGIIGLTNLLLSSTEDKISIERLRIIQNCGNSLLDLINDVLDFSKLEVNKVELELQSFPLHIIVNEVLELFHQRATEKGIALSYSYESNVPKLIISDVTRFRQILINLIANAIKFTETGSVEIKSQAVCSIRNKWEIEFSIKDTGIGIPDDLQDKLFQSFSQVDASTTRRFGGTGLGLAICKGLCEKMGGSISFERNIGKGSIFKFSFKAEESDLMDVIEPIDPFKLVDANMGISNPLRILLVEDNRTNQIVAAGYLKKLSYIVDIAANGKEALDYLSQQSYDLILMDCHMPVMDGFEATRKIKKLFLDSNSPRIVALTASMTSEDTKNCYECGMDGVIVKPITIPNLLKVLKECISFLNTSRKSS